MNNRFLDGEGDLDFAPREDIDAYHDLALEKILWLRRHDCSEVEEDAPSCTWPLSDVRQRFRSLPILNSTSRVDFSDTAIDSVVRRSSAAGSTIVYATSGSTGSPKVLLDSYADVLHNSRFHGKGYRACGIQPSDRVVVLGEIGRFASEYAVLHALSITGSMIIPFVDRTRIEANIAYMRDMGANVWLAMQSEMFPYLTAFERAGQNVPPLRLVVTGGEAISAKTCRRLRSIFGTGLRVRSTFQTSDAGTIGYQCAFCDTDEYHIHEELQFVEILDADDRETRNPGLLVVTNLLRGLLQTVRFQTGDWARWSPDNKACPCRRTARRIRLIGRAERVVSLGSTKIEISRLESIRSIASDAGMQCQIALMHDPNGRTYINVHSSETLQACLQRRVLEAFEQLDAYVNARRDGSVNEPIFRVGFSDDDHYRGFSKFIPVIETFQ